MAELKTICRVTVYADGSLEEGLLGALMRLGSTGYTIMECRGKGEHDSVESPLGSINRIRIELLVQPAVAEKMIAFIDSDQLKRHGVAACMETVQVAASEKY